MESGNRGKKRERWMRAGDEGERPRFRLLLVFSCSFSSFKSSLLSERLEKGNVNSSSA